MPQPVTAGRTPTVEESANPLVLARTASRMTLVYATHFVGRASMEWDQCAGKDAHQGSLIPELIA
jgi:hypothetical protein